MAMLIVHGIVKHGLVICTLLIFMMQAAGGIISASLLSTPGASGFYKGGLTVRLPLSFLIVLSIADS